jgi:CO/xanthine dehydrogenase Mo-binding subunit
MTTTERAFGASHKRLEDARFITGQGTYTDNMVLPGMLHLAVARSPIAHATIKSIDTQAAAAMPGVVGVFTGEDMANAGYGGLPCAWVVPNSDTVTPPHPPIATDRVRYVGDAVAIVVADTEANAKDAALAVAVDYDPRRGCCVRRSRRGGQRLLRQPAPHSQRHGAAGGAGPRRQRHGRTHPVGDESEPAHRAVPPVAGHAVRRTQDPGDRTRRRRRVRFEDPALRRRLHGHLRRPAGRRTGEVDRDQE